MKPPGYATSASGQAPNLTLGSPAENKNPFSFAAYKSWGRVFEDKSEAAQRAVYADPEFRNAFREAHRQGWEECLEALDQALGKSH